MFTEKQIKEFNKYMETARVEDLPTPDMPEFILPSWLPSDVGTVLLQYVEHVSGFKYHESRLYYDMWPAFVRYVTTILPAFTEPSIKDVWINLYKESPSKTVQFAETLLSIENEFGGTVRMFYKQKYEKECCERMIQKSLELHDVMEEYHCHYFGHMLQKNHFKIMKIIKEFSQKTQKDLDDFKKHTGDISYLFSDYSPITREFKSDNALPIFFARKISLFFQREFGKPKHRFVADFINVMFGIQYDDNEIIKITSKIKPLLKK